MNHRPDPNAEFWNKQAAAFTAGDGLRRSYHAEFADILNRELAGSVLCVGGLYQNLVLSPGRRLFVVDVSVEMLRVWASRGVSAQVGDARCLPVANDSLDHIVYPLVLHHITDGQAAASRRNVRECFREAWRVLRPGGTMWAIEIFVSNPVYLAELALAPVTRMALATRKIPLVVFHAPSFYLSELANAGFSTASVTYTTADHRWYELQRPVIGLALAVPRFMVPVKYGLLRAVKPR